MTIEQFLAENVWLIVVSLATLPIKGFALWSAARLSQKWWFMLLLVTSTFGILDLAYILFVARRYKVETKEEVAN